MPIALAAIHGNKEAVFYLSMLKGNSQALSQVASDKNCKNAINLSLKKTAIFSSELLKFQIKNRKKLLKKKRSIIFNSPNNM